MLASRFSCCADRWTRYGSRSRQQAPVTERPHLRDPGQAAGRVHGIATKAAANRTAALLRSRSVKLPAPRRTKQHNTSMADVIASMLAGQLACRVVACASRKYLREDGLLAMVRSGSTRLKLRPGIASDLQC